MLLPPFQVPALAQKLGRVFEWVFHMGQNQVLDSDAMLLHVQVRAVHGWAGARGLKLQLLSRRPRLRLRSLSPLPPSHTHHSPQERQLHLGADPNWRTAFYLPASADTGIVKFRCERVPLRSRVAAWLCPQPLQGPPEGVTPASQPGPSMIDQELPPHPTRTI